MTVQSTPADSRRQSTASKGGIFLGERAVTQCASRLAVTRATFEPWSASCGIADSRRTSHLHSSLRQLARAVPSSVRCCAPFDAATALPDFLEPLRQPLHDLWIALSQIPRF
jgi:hypothetical protein